MASPAVPGAFYAPPTSRQVPSNDQASAFNAYFETMLEGGRSSEIPNELMPAFQAFCGRYASMASSVVTGGEDSPQPQQRPRQRRQHRSNPTQQLSDLSDILSLPANQSQLNSALLERKAYQLRHEYGAYTQAQQRWRQEQEREDAWQLKEAAEAAAQAAAAKAKARVLQGGGWPVPAHPEPLAINARARPVLTPPSPGPAARMFQPVRVLAPTPTEPARRVYSPAMARRLFAAAPLDSGQDAAAEYDAEVLRYQDHWDQFKALAQEMVGHQLAMGEINMRLMRLAARVEGDGDGVHVPRGDRHQQDEDKGIAREQPGHGGGEMASPLLGLYCKMDGWVPVGGRHVRASARRGTPSSSHVAGLASRR
ncbi:hypothetical protein Ct61P_15422 [Colletotrichum tofieldiae]|nr:hypothetical protein Ct61P_15422 [Colletotrichum tofieldiae]